jgi:hypothetical protein
MSTRAVYSFYGNNEAHHVYKHYDGYPEGGVKYLHNARGYAFDFPRYESGDFAAAFVAANKVKGGDVQLVNGNFEPPEVHSDCEFWYKIFYKKAGLFLEIFSVDWCTPGEQKNKLVFEGLLDDALVEFPSVKYA